MAKQTQAAAAPAPSTTAIEKTAEETALASRPAWVDGGRVGYDTLDPHDIMNERVSLMQDGNPEVKQQHKYQSGDVVRKTIDEVLYTRGGPPVLFTVVSYFKEYVEFGDRKKPQEPVVLQRSTNPNSKLAEDSRQWVKKKLADGKEVRKVNDVHNFVILLEGRPTQPLLLQMAKSSYKSGAALVILLNQLGDSPIYSGQFELTTEEKTNSDGTFNVYRVKRSKDAWAGKATYDSAATLHRLIADALTKGTLKPAMDESDRPDDGRESAAETAAKTNDI